MSKFESMSNYATLGYETTLTMMLGKEAVRMVKVYSHKTECSISCEQIHEFSSSKDEYFFKVLDFMYNDIQEQEKTGKLRILLNEYLKT
jgi:hypothetical protein